MPTNDSQQGGRVEPAGSVGAAAPRDMRDPRGVYEPQEPRRTFWQHPFVLNVLPFTTSVLLHAGVLLVGVALYQARDVITTVIREQIIIPDAQIIEGAEVGGVPNPGLGADPNIVSDIKVEMQEQTQKLAEKSASIASSIGGEAAGEGVIGIGAGTIALRGGGQKSGGTADSTPFGVPGGSGGLGPKSPFMGVSGNARRIAYICDASGGMVNVQTLLKRELCQAVDVLKPIQFFNIFFFTSKASNGYECYQKGRLVPATPANKLGAISSDNGWVTETYEAYGDGDPIPALRAAMAQEPELIYLLTDGFEEARGDSSLARRVRDEIRRLNAGNKVRVNTILIRTPRNAESARAAEQLKQIDDLKAVLKEIADQNGGRYKVVDPDQ